MISLRPPYGFKINIILFLVVSALLVGVAESVLRATHLFNARISWAQPDALIGYRHTPNMEYWHNDENDHPISGRFNRYGYRGKDWSIKKAPGTYRIAVLGDSYVEAFQVETEKTFLDLTKSRLNITLTPPVELMNFGRSGFTQSEEYIVLQREVTPFYPDMVILFFLPGNDIEDISDKTASTSFRPFYSFTENGKLHLDTSFTDTFEFKLKSLINGMKQRSILISFIMERINMLNSKLKRTDKSNRKYSIGGALSLCTDNPDKAFLTNYSLNKVLIREMAAFCRGRGIRFMLVTIDNPAYIPEVEEEYKSIDPTFNANFFEDDLSDFARLLGIDYLGLQRIFTEAYKTKKIPLHWGHWNYEGHRVVADALSRKLGATIYNKSASYSH
jgi:hypothetical protein